MLINYGSNKKSSKISLHKNVDNSAVFSFVEQLLECNRLYT
jgi:hypothetical protein